jgi:hypothetical protein
MLKINGQKLPSRCITVKENTYIKESGPLEMLKSLVYRYGPRCGASIDAYNGMECVFRPKPSWCLKDSIASASYYPQT